MHVAKEYIIEFNNFDDYLFNFNYSFTEALITTSATKNKLDIINLKERIEELYQFFKLSDQTIEKYLKWKASDKQIN